MDHSPSEHAHHGGGGSIDNEDRYTHVTVIGRVTDRLSTLRRHEETGAQTTAAQP